MYQFKHTVRQFCPPILWSLLKHGALPGTAANKAEKFSGNYHTWQQAKSKSLGYENDLILEKCKNALLQVKNGEAVYERDSVLFDEIQYSFGVLSGLQKIALDHGGDLCVLDFGGSLGSTYFQNKGMLSSLRSLQWCIVEQPHFVECGKQYFEDDQLHFFYTVEECIQQYKPHVILFSGVLQYLEQPMDMLQHVMQFPVEYIILDRIAFIDADQDRITVQHVPTDIYPASYPHTFFSKAQLKQAFMEKGYQELLTFESGADPSEYLSTGERVYWLGGLYKKTTAL